MVSSYLKYSTATTEPCTLSASSAPAVRLHGPSLHICGTSTRCCNHTVTSNPERICFTTTVFVAYTLPNALLIEDMVTLTALVKIHSTEYFCNTKVAGLGEIFVQ